MGVANETSPVRGRGRGKGVARGGARGRGRGRGVAAAAKANSVVKNGTDTPPGSSVETNGVLVTNGLQRSFSDKETKFTGMSTLGSASSLDRLMTSEGEGEFDEPTTADNINVVIRVRPISKKEQNEGDTMICKFPGEGQIWLDLSALNQKPKSLTYNVVFEPEATQDDVLRHSGITRLVEMALDGFSCTAFCYGQTGSGKTHTLTGPPHLFEKTPNPFAEEHGLIFRSFVHLFSQVEERKVDRQFVLRASFLEIYNEKVIDLLNIGTARKPLAVRWSKKSRGFFVENLFTVECQELDDLLAVLGEGMKNRAMGSHNMNEHSSRSHTILTVYIASEQKASEDGVFISRHGKLNFVDLAGSEMSKKTHSEGKTLEEANNINKSLMVLGYCIAQLSDSKKKNGHIPYRDSKLTKLLADSLAGNGVTLMIACISPARTNTSETLNTLRYAARAKRIKTKPVVVMDPREALILSLKREVGSLRTENQHLRSMLSMSPENGKLPLKPGGVHPPVELMALPNITDIDSLKQMDSEKLADMSHQFLQENAMLRRETAELAAVKDVLLRDQELVCRENERLLKKLEDVNSVCCRSPIAPARPTYSAEILSQSSTRLPMERPSSLSSPMHDVWSDETTGTTKLSDIIGGPRSPSRLTRSQPATPQSPTASRRPHRLPDNIQKEMERRKIGKSMNNIAETYKEKSHQRKNSWDGGKPDEGQGGSPPLPPVRGRKITASPTAVH